MTINRLKNIKRMKRSKSILMHFDSKHDFLHGIDALQHYKIPICEVYTPKRIYGLEDKLKIKKIRMGYRVLKFGCLGGTAATTLAYYLFSPGSVANFTGRSLFELISNLFIMLTTLLFATRLFPGQAPKVFNLGPDDRRYLIVVEAGSTIPHEDISNLFEYSGAVELSPAIKKMIIS